MTATGSLEDGPSLMMASARFSRYLKVDHAVVVESSVQSSADVGVLIVRRTYLEY